jgi:hypothetical protein
MMFRSYSLKLPIFVLVFNFVFWYFEKFKNLHY